ncbi:BCCT family transporter [Steroidobacter sp. S1-65]|uniref:BCCT family transporter n=1 Tax=Steroidobacter gossypii TaxID=2805490 RepID=A0ABS1WYB8_9GAMM|nr:BCCT family transporter [Steroidobacter gossypii]MBM0105982.1 BCCT family transporter [Steroidobacter gossypii]
MRFQVNPPVFFTSAAVILVCATLGALFPARARLLFQQLQAGIIEDFGWLYIAAVAGFLIFALFLLFSRYGDVKLGPDDSEPEYGGASWFAMLFSAGMGIGLMFFGVAEPIQHYMAPPTGEGATLDAARQAMVLTFFHWGLHAWAIYVIVGLALAYFAFRRGLPLTLRSALHPLIGDRIHGPIGHAVDVFAVFGTMFGVATSLGLGVLQVNAGATYLFGWPATIPVQLMLIAAVTGLATLSVMLGLDRGIRRLSELNVVLASLLLLFVLIAGPTLFLLRAYVQNIGAYLSNVVPLTFRLYAYEPNPWLGEWTLFYWSWWIAWSPFVGMFIARISRGRTIRQFIGGVLLVPVLFTFLWMTVFGNTALWQQTSEALPLAEVVRDNLPVALFASLEGLPLATLSSAIATILVVTFFVTSADSGALVIDTITSGGAADSPAWQRVFWATAAGAIAAVLLVGGGLDALQTATIASALPFTILMIFICYGVLRALQLEGTARADSALIETTHVETSWQQRLSMLLKAHTRADIESFLADVAAPALQDVAARIQEEGHAADFNCGPDRVELAISHAGRQTFRYSVRLKGFRAPTFALAERPLADTGDSERSYHALAESSVDGVTDVTAFTRQQLIDDFLARYARSRALARKQ